MKVNFTTKLKNLKGTVLLESFIDKAGEMQENEVSLSDVAVTALTRKADKDMKPVEKMLRYKIAQKIVGGKDINLTDDELKKIKDCIGEEMPTMYVGASFELLDK